MKITAEKIGVAGDWHGAGSWAWHQIYNFSRRDIKHVFQVGDFGLWHGSGEAFADKVEQACDQFDVVVYVTLGNHENYDLYEQLLASGENVDEENVLWLRPHIAILPRPFLFEINDLKVASLGGAPSIDKEWRTPHFDWWPQEIFTFEMLETARTWGKVDIVLAHDAPSRGAKEIEDIIQYNPQGWSKDALRYCKYGRDLMDAAIEALEPELWFHGHYHRAGQGFGHNRCVVTSLDMNGQKKANVVLDLNTMAPEWA